ncbi:MAG: DUF4976 domain-containing protein [Spirochaetaceae bacterium]|nr:MAG: DUF4976 domain-containing protein [Spirochaetaceae bacterium]
MGVDRPNILWIFSDQHRGQALGCAGDANVNTPNLDRLAADGVRFPNAYSNTPICAPFRASLYTGKRITSHGVNSLFVPLLPEHRVLPQELRDVGYRTAHFGKWHLSGGDCPSHFVSPYFRPGWDDWVGWENSNRPWNTEYSAGDLPMPIQRLNGYQTDAMVDLSIEWLARRESDAPWFHVLSIEPPHPPYTAPERNMARVRGRDIMLRPNVPVDRPDVDQRVSTLRAYYAQIENLDENVGRLLDALEETGQADNTIVCYFSDHGDFMGSHGRGDKTRPELESSLIPLIIRYPGTVPPGVITDALICGLDLMPTTLGLAGLAVPDYVEGVDMSPVVRGEVSDLREAVLLQYDQSFYGTPRPWETFRSYVTKRWMYSRFLVRDQSHLYDLESDPYQLTNLIADPEHRETVAELDRLLTAELERISDPVLELSDWSAPPVVAER